MPPSLGRLHNLLPRSEKIELHERPKVLQKLDHDALGQDYHLWRDVGDSLLQQQNKAQILSTRLFCFYFTHNKGKRTQGSMEDRTKAELAQRIDKLALRQQMANSGLLSNEEVVTLEEEKQKLKEDIGWNYVLYLTLHSTNLFFLD